MSDKTRIYPAATAPPSYTESVAQPKADSGVKETSLQGAQAPKDIPPPYHPPQGTQGAPGPGYQRFDHVVDRPVAVVAVIELGPKPCHLQCPCCGNTVYTYTVLKAGALTWIASVFCFFFCIICTCLPCCVTACLDVDHYCPRCNYFFGTFTRI